MTKQPAKDKIGRQQQLISEIGRPLLEQAFDTLKAEIDAGIEAGDYPLEAKWFAILEQLDAGNPMVLLPLLNVPKEVKPHFEDAFRRLKLSKKGQRRPPIPSYRPVSLQEAKATQAARLVSELVQLGANEEKSIELASLLYKGVPSRTKLKAVLKGKASGVRNLRARRAAR
jgi:hypothetical protein